MKKVTLFMCMLLAAMAVNAQDFFSQGYRGLADLGYTVGVGDYCFGRFEISTTHGYQVCPYFFVGAGVGVHFMSKYETKGMGEYALDIRDSKVSIPMYIDLHSTFMQTKFAPFVDVKLGHFLTGGDGLYANASVGVRMATTDKQAVNLSVGYTFEKLEFQTFGHFLSTSSMAYTRSPRKLDAEGISIKLGYEF